MNEKNITKIVLYILGGILTISITIMALFPMLNSVLKVEVQTKETSVTSGVLPTGKPEELLVTAMYGMKKETKTISAIYIEVFHVGSNTVSYLEVPVNTKVTLSSDLYQSLQTYSPELPQYLKLSKMAEKFSDEYAWTGCNRILSEVLGVSLSHYISADAAMLKEWMMALEEEKKPASFFDCFTEYVQNTASDMSVEERWMYYENWMTINSVVKEMAPGSPSKDEYTVSEKQSKELLEEWMTRKDTE